MEPSINPRTKVILKKLSITIIKWTITFQKLTRPKTSLQQSTQQEIIKWIHLITHSKIERSPHKIDLKSIQELVWINCKIGAAQSLMNSINQKILWIWAQSYRMAGETQEIKHKSPKTFS